MTGCEQLAEVCDEIVTEDPEISPSDYLRALGNRVAGIDTGIEGIIDLARGGSNEISGRGFKPEFDDDSDGQARHFAGTAASVAIFGGRATEFVTHTFLDPPDTPDGRLSSAAVEFATQILDESLPLTEASDWIRDNICAPDKPETAIRIEPPPGR